jgi:dihydroorotate dehydrogenase electron transfer subunit
MALHIATVEYNRQLQVNIYLLSMLNSALAESVKPGQFITIKVGKGSIPLLRRPFSIFSAAVVEGLAPRVEILYKVVGPATELMSHLQVGEQVSVLGPLGNPYPDSFQRPLLIAGGTGIAGLHFLAQRLLARKIKPTILFGVRSKDELIPLPTLAGADLHLACEDGSAGFRGDVVTLSKKYLSSDFDAVYVCGPQPMLYAFHQVLPPKLPCFVSLEETMACGVGACRGCAHPLANGTYASVCLDGPVFNWKDLKW